MAAVIHLPAQPARLRAGIDAVRARAGSLGATAVARRAALQTLLTELQAGRSTAASVAIANSSLLPCRFTPSRGGAA